MDAGGQRGPDAARDLEARGDDRDAVLMVSTVLSGLHGIDGAALSVPSIVSASGAHPIERTPFDDGELERLHASADALHRAAAGLRG